jgi:hypothetical protein
VRIGLDLDNTIICYDGVFHDVGCRLGLLPREVSPDKLSVRAHLRDRGREEDWTRLQGLVYGPHLGAARPYAGVADFFEACRAVGAEVFIVSHRTRNPILGEPHDLHAAARDWLVRQGLVDGPRGLAADHVFLETEREGKLARIAQLGCDVFVDDLEELLSDPAFPAGIRRILFGPGRRPPARPGIEVAASWSELRALVVGPSPGATAPDLRAVGDLLARAGLLRDSALEALPHAGNNRVFRVSSQPPALLKWYFAHPDDRRDRFGAEWALTRFAWRRGLRTLPQPLAADPPSRLALYSLLPGQPLTAVTEDAVRQAAAFVRALNADRAGDEAASLPFASEACFSVGEHLRLVEARLDRLAGLEGGSGARDVARTFVREQVMPAARETLGTIRARAGEDAGRLLGLEERIISPSDFGFHNAIEAGGTIRFFDFEYAGWDDPAKMACDFFCQPRQPVPLASWPLFTKAAGLSEADVRRAGLLLPAYRLKWCCILLNDFLPEGRARRTFAGGEAPDEDGLMGQLDKARRALASATDGVAPGGWAEERGGATTTRQ